jgi:uncharacterized membrane protein
MPTTLRGNGFHHTVPAPATPSTQNVSEAERVLSMVGGSLLALFGVSRKSPGGLLLSALGAGLVYRGVTGNCPAYSALGLSTAQRPAGATGVPAGRGLKLSKTIQVTRAAPDLYRFWRNLENLPRLMPYLRSVTSHGNRSHWIATGPLGIQLQWDAEIINDVPNKLIAWRTLPGSDVDSAGSVHFHPLTSGWATKVTVTLKYDPPAGKVGSALATLLGKDPERQLEMDLHRFKQIMETGELPLQRGQISGLSG